MKKNRFKSLPDIYGRLSAVGLAGLIHCTGYYDAKAGKLHTLVIWLSTACADDLSVVCTCETPVLRRQLLNVQGSGPEKADSILLHAAG